MSPSTAKHRRRPQLRLIHLFVLVAAIAIGLAFLLSFFDHQGRAVLRVRMGVSHGQYFSNDAKHGGFKASVVQRAKSDAFRRRIARRTGASSAWIKNHVKVQNTRESELITLSGKSNSYFDGNRLESVLKEYVDELSLIHI